MAFDYIGRKEDDVTKITDKFAVIENGVEKIQWPIKYNVRKPIDRSWVDEALRGKGCGGVD